MRRRWEHEEGTIMVEKMLGNFEMYQQLSMFIIYMVYLLTKVSKPRLRNNIQLSVLSMKYDDIILINRLIDI